MAILDYILRFIWAILTVSFVGLIVHFRKPLKSILHALADMETLKAGPLEFKRREQTKKILDSIQLEYKEDPLKDEKFQTILKISNNRLEQLLLTSTIGLHIAYVSKHPQMDEVKEIRDMFYIKLKSIDPDSENLRHCDYLISEGYVPPVEESQQSNP